MRRYVGAPWTSPFPFHNASADDGLSMRGDVDDRERVPCWVQEMDQRQMGRFPTFTKLGRSGIRHPPQQRRRWQGSRRKLPPTEEGLMVSKRLIGLLGALVLIGAAFAPHAAHVSAQDRIAIATGGTGGVYFPYGGALASLISEHG